MRPSVKRASRIAALLASAAPAGDGGNKRSGRRVSAETGDLAARQGGELTRLRLERASIGLDGRISADDEHRTRMLTHPSQTVYGEITFDGVRRFMDYCMQDAFARHQRHVFYDLGSGVGRMVVQVHLDYPQVRRSVGVELSRERHDMALELHRRVLSGDSSVELALQPSSACEFRCGDILEADFSDATIVWVANSFFHEDFLEKLCSKMANQAPKLLFVGMNDPLSAWGLEFSNFELAAELRLPMSWDVEWTAYIYRRRRVDGTIE